MHFPTLAVLLSLSVLTNAAPTHNYVLHERRDFHHHGWQKRGLADRGIIMPMRIGMAQSNLHLLDDLLMAVSDPKSPAFGNHYSQAEIHELFAPSAGAVGAIQNWLESHGISGHGLSHNKQWYQFDASVEKAEEMFKTSYHLFEHIESGKNHIGCDEYHLPEHLVNHVDYITPGLRLMPTRQGLRGRTKRSESIHKRTNVLPGPIIGNPLPSTLLNLSRSEQATLCDKVIFPICIEQLYNYTQGGSQVGGNDLGIFEEGDYYGKEDLVEYFTSVAQNVPPAYEPIENDVDGGFDTSVATGESDLDFQLAIPIVYPQDTVLYQTDDPYYSTVNFTIGNGIFNTFLDAIDGSYCTLSKYGETGNSPIDPVYPDPHAPAPVGYQGALQCGAFAPTNVISFSYGLAEASMPTRYMQRQCYEYGKLGMQGISLIFATQDAGVAARYQVGPNANDCLGTNGEVFAPDFPANCPYVTGVGSTALTNGTTSARNEHATDQFGSGAGFSNVFITPRYQSSAVSKYLSTYEPKLTGFKRYNLTTPTASPTEAQTKGGLFNAGGRAYPDLSAIGENILIILDGAPVQVGGTSAATPIFAALMTRINGERIKAGKKRLGFLNPLLYANPGMFNDITVGNSPGCNTTGFYTAPGWDPSTGLGTPNYPAMLKYFLALN